MKTKIKAISELILGGLFIIMSVLGYYREIPHMWEYCFLSGLTVGIVFLIAFVYYLIKKKHLAEWIFLACVTDISVILIATAVMKLNLNGAFWFIHIINPVLLLIFWIVFCDSRNIRTIVFISTTLAFPLTYLAVSFVCKIVTGICAFPANYILNWTPQIIALPVVLVLSAILLLLGLGLYYLNRFTHRVKKEL